MDAPASHPGRRFRYGLDPLFVGGLTLYLVHRQLIKPTAWGSAGFLHDYLNDLLLIPVVLPPLLFVHRRLGLRGHDRPPTPAEVGLHVVLWSVLFYGAFPHHAWLFRHSTADPYNIGAYAAGAAAAWLWWNRPVLTAAAGPDNRADLPITGRGGHGPTTRLRAEASLLGPEGAQNR